ncbi:hypothetical protein CPC16_007337 [Podila verticillata]|nr:hypothetical protein BGZ52_007790 [Haplosporangium bisporale]KAF9212569.1 hypothetical protein BGZ59_006593 [Podila verticillata]KAF9395691.1 hypothetical protein CPC16_007337 [Podila verticillata]KAI9235056.1 MAG: hypothetical protein BYD32DRAFT_463788 [Podila humilis]KFH74096.1 hypothetical protein MVEG_01309 [Podila verticillata NRRL 6337]
MHKFLVLLLTLSSSAFAYKCLIIKNNSGSQSFRFCVNDADRQCFCVKNTQTGSIKGDNGGDIKLFSTTDCTGNFQTLGTNSGISNTQWVNSISLGASGKPSYSDGFCPNWYTA